MKLYSFINQRLSKYCSLSQITFLLRYYKVGTVCVSLFINILFINSEANAQNVIQTENLKSQQNVRIKGKVVADNPPQGVPGANIFEGDKAIGITAVNGEFSISVKVGTIITFKYLGYQDKNITISKADDNLVVSLVISNKALNEVVVTALNIKREEKSLGYSTQKIDGSELSNAPSTGFINALSGKVAGLNLTNSGGPMGSSKVVLRGESVMDINSSGALIVVDGVPISTAFEGTGDGAYLGGDSPIDFGSALTDIDPNNIESVNVLKGPAASALYGSRAGSGAIIITTKNGNNKKGMGVTFTSNVAFDNVNHWPDYQSEYGQGSAGNIYYSYGRTEDGAGTGGGSVAWGPKFDGQEYFQYNSPKDENGVFTSRTPWVAYEDAYKGFFKTGKTVSNNLSLSNSTDKGRMRFGLSHMKNDWILDNTGYERIIASLSTSNNLSKKLSVNTKFSYYNKFSDNLPASGFNNQSVMYFMIFQNPNIDLDWYKPYWLPGKEGIEQNRPFSKVFDNPYLIVNELLNKSDRHNLTGNVSATYNIAKNLDITLRTGIDAGYEFRSQQRPKNSQKFQFGMYRQQTVFNYESNSDFLVQYKYNRIKSLKITGSIGGNSLIQSRKFTNQIADRLKVPGVYNLTNSEQLPTTTSALSEKRINSLYGFLNFGYRDYLFLDVTGRNDWSSTLPSRNNSFFYPSATLSMVVSDMANLPEWVSFAKLRGAFASVGYDAPLGTYNLERVYESGTYPGELSNPSIIANPNLKPQRNDALEFGADLRFFKSRLALDVTVYNQLVKNQITRAPAEYSTGYSTSLINMGEVLNKGIEVTLKGTPIKNLKNFTWDVTMNWSANKGMVQKLDEETKNVILASYVGSRVTIEAREGERLGEMYGLGFLRSPEGEIVFDQSGYPLLSSEKIKLGSTTPKWRSGLNNNFKYKNWSASVLFDQQFGGKVFSLTNSLLSEHGKTKATLPGRDNGIIGDGVMLDGSGNYVKNTTLVSPAKVATYYSRWYGRDNVEANTFSSNYVKLREATINYKFPTKILRKTFIKEATVGLYGRNLFVWTKFPAYDPETGTLSSSTIIPGLEIAQYPSTRTMGVNLQVSF